MLRVSMIRVFRRDVMLRVSMIRVFRVSMARVFVRRPFAVKYRFIRDAKHRVSTIPKLDLRRFVS